MPYKNIYFRLTAALVLLTFVSNTLSPIVLTTHAVGTDYFIDFNTGNDSDDGSAGTPWKTLTNISGSVLNPGDNVWLACNSTWTGGLSVTRSGGPGAPITFRPWQNTYQCNTSTYPVVEKVSIQNQTDISFFRVNITSDSATPSIDIGNAGSISITEGKITNPYSGPCVNAFSLSGLTLSGNSISDCTYAFSGGDIGGTISNNTFSGMTADALQILSNQSLNVNNNTFSYLQKGAIVFGQATVVSQNIISNVCQGAGTGCSAIHNEEFSPANTSYLSARVSENIIQNVGSGITSGNYGISARSIRDLEIANNTVNNAEESLHLEDTNSFNIHDNTFVMPRARVVQVIQNTSGTVGTNTFQSNTILGKNPDYPYIEMRDETVGGAMGNFLSFSSTDFFPLFKPNTSYIREVKYGGETREYTKKDLAALDSSISKFEYFAYSPYTSTGAPVGGNQVGNGSFLTNTNGWSVGAELGLAPTLSYNPTGSYSGGSATVSPALGSPDRIWLTNNTNISLTVGRIYEITGYAKSASGNINLRVFLHSASDKNIIYSDRIAETYASASGRTFSLYLQAMTGASDARLTIETSNPDVGYEIDEVSMLRIFGLSRNDGASDIYPLANTTASSMSQGCPGGCLGNFVDTLGVTISWPRSIAPYRTLLALNSASSQKLSPPTCGLTPNPTSPGAGEMMSLNWTFNDTLSGSVDYQTYLGRTYTQATLPSGSVWFIPSLVPGNTSHFCIAENDVGTTTNQFDISISNLPPQLYIGSFAGIEDGADVAGTLSGYDFSGDPFYFGITSNPPATQGLLVLTDAGSGNFLFSPYPDFCGTTSFDFNASESTAPFRTVPSVTQPITITCVNDAPFLNSTTKSATGFTAMPSPITITEGVSGDFTDPDQPYDAQTFTTNFTQPANGTLTLLGGGGPTDLEYTSNLGFSGTDSFTYSITDQSGSTTATGTVDILVTRYNNPPIATDSGYTVNEDGVLNGVLTGSDIDADPVSFSALTLPNSGSLSVLANGNFTYTPNLNINGSDSFIFQITDGVATSTGMITITIDPVPDAPVAIADSFTVVQDTLTPLSVMSNDSDADASPLTLTGYTQPTHGTLVVNGSNFDYTPNSGYVGSDSFTYRLEDDTSLLSSVVTVTLTVTSTNSAPTTSDMSVSVNEDSVLNSTLSGSDPDMDTLTYSINTFPTHGTLTISSTGAFRYISNANYYGTDSFTYHASDASLSSTSSTVTITINPINDSPLGIPASYSVTPNTNSNSGNIFTGVVAGTDIDSGILTFTASTMPTHGTLTLASSGAFTYTPALGYIGSDSFTFIVSDGSLQSSATTVSLSIGSAPVVSPGPSSGGGGGGGGGGGSLPNPVVTATTSTGTVQVPVIPKKPNTKTGTSTSTEDPEFNSAPEVQAPQFVLYDPTGLLSQLMLTNRVLTASGLSPIFISPILQTTLAEKIFGEIPTMMLDDFDGPAILRSMLQMFVMEADNQGDVLETYSNAIDYVGGFDFSDSKRMKNTQNYILRILERNRKHYEQIVQRDIFSRFEGELNSASEEIQTTDF